MKYHSVERAAFYMLDEPYVRASLDGIGATTADRQLCPVGSVEFVRAWINHLGLEEPQPVDYPAVLRGFMGRNLLRFDDPKQIPFITSFPVFIKPVATKAWTGFVAKERGEVTDLSGPVWVSDAVEFREEYRFYVKDGRILFVGRYDEFEEGYESPPAKVVGVVQRMIVALASSLVEIGPWLSSVYALDAGICTDGLVRLVEITDAWACGLYKPDAALYPAYRQDYFAWLYARWEQIAGIGHG
ncbi:ATP-grasp domain-containing protein [Ferrovum sp.]|uniref:ATP-grasp domain-containing protein n=1 Tax=Ferrovum sp. TaxID=2609467 RepID=UPI00261B6C67|nr:ATP-grasp domain-containing protein [Ferrovum sp.]